MSITNNIVFEIFDLKNAVTLKTGLWVKVIDRMHERDRQTDRQTDGRTDGHRATAKTALTHSVAR